MFTIAFTGSRPKGLYGYGRDDAYHRLGSGLAVMVSRLMDRHQDDLVFWTGGAQGADQMAFRAVQAMKDRAVRRICNNVAVPFPGQDAAWGTDGLFSRREYRSMLHDADDVVVLDPERRHAAAADYHARNRFMVDKADRVIAVSLRDPSAANRSGTGATVRYALGHGKAVCWYDPARYGSLTDLSRISRHNSNRCSIQTMDMTRSS